MNKTAKTTALAVGALVAVAAIAAVVVLGQLGRLIEDGVEEHGPGLTGTDVALGSASVSIFSGEGELRSLSIDNPKGFSDDKAFDLGRIRIAVEPKSLASGVVHIRQIVVDGPKLLAEFDASGRNNLSAILDHVRAAAGGGGKSSGDSGGGGKKMIVDEFRFENAEARALAPAFDLDKTVKIPPVVLKDLGKRQGGLAVADIANQVMRPIVDSTVKAASREYLRAQGAKAKTRLLDKILQ
jgi:hypothetical protein